MNNSRMARELTSIVNNSGETGSVASDNAIEFSCNPMLARCKANAT